MRRGEQQVGGSTPDAARHGGPAAGGLAGIALLIVAAVLVGVVLFGAVPYVIARQRRPTQRPAEATV